MNLLAFQVNDVIRAMEADAGVSLSQLKIDGGASANNLLAQMQTDFCRAPVLRPKCVETTAMGAAYLAGLAVGYWTSLEDICQNWQMDKLFTPNMTIDEANRQIAGWKKAVQCSFGWAKED